MSKPYVFTHSALKQTTFEKDPQAWYACAICSLYTSMRMLGIYELSPRQIHSQFIALKSLKCIRKCGPTLADLERVATDNGLMFFYKEFPLDEEYAWSWMMKMSAKALPILIFPPEHCVVGWAISKKGCWIMDPDSKKDFQYYSKPGVFKYWRQGSGDPFLRCAVVARKTHKTP